MSLMLGRRSSQRGKRPWWDDRNQTGNTTDFVGLMNEPTDIRQVKIPTIAVGLIMSVAVIVGAVTWSSARLVARIDHLEATVASIEQTMDMQSFARVEDVSEDLEDIWAEVDGINTTLDGVMDSVGLLLMQNEQSFWEN